MLKSVKEYFERAWKWIQALWDKHDEALEQMVSSVLPMVIELALRSDMSGSDKKKAITDAVLHYAVDGANDVADSLVNEAVEIALNRYNIQLGVTTKEKIDSTLDAVVAAGEAFAHKQLNLTEVHNEEVSE